MTAVCEYLAAPIRALRRGLPTAVVPCIVEPQGAVSEPPGGEGAGSINMVTVGGSWSARTPWSASTSWPS